MRMILHSLIAGALVALAWTTSLVAYAYDLTCRVGSYIRETLIWTFVASWAALRCRPCPADLSPKAAGRLPGRPIPALRWAHQT
jgi:hypothetical protein